MALLGPCLTPCCVLPDTMRVPRPAQTGSLLLNAVSPTQVSVRVPQMLTGFSLTLNASSLTTTPVAAGAGCVYIL